MELATGETAMPCGGTHKGNQPGRRLARELAAAGSFLL